MADCPYPVCVLPFIDGSLRSFSASKSLGDFLQEMLGHLGELLGVPHLAVLTSGDGQLLAGDPPPEGLYPDLLAQEERWEADRFLLNVTQPGGWRGTMVGWGFSGEVTPEVRQALRVAAKLAGFSACHWENHQALEQRSSYFEALFQQGQDAVFVHEMRAGRLVKLLEVNEPGLTLLGRDVAQLRALSLAAVFPVRHLPEVRWQLQRVWEQGGTQFDLEMSNASGEAIPVEIRAHRFLLQGKTLVMTIARDLHKLRSLEKQLLLAQKMEDLGRLAGGIAHDFNNLLTVIQTYSEFVQGEMLADDPLREDVAEVLRACTGASRLTRQLLDFSRRQPVEPLWVPLMSTVEGATQMLRRILGERVHLTLSGELEQGSVYMDPGHIEQIVVNLVVNARDAMPAGGSIVIRVHGNATEVRLEVEDDGVGMPPEVQARIFEPFFTTKGGRGTGLGLATVFRIVEQYHGEISVRSTLGRGSCFSVVLPRRGGVEDGSSSEAPRGVLVGGQQRILLVEDHGPVRRLIARLLRRKGFRVVSAQGPGEALLLAEQKEAFDLVITDVAMPLMSGPEMMTRLRLGQPGLPAVMMSGYSGRPLQYFGLTDDEVLQKPINEEALLAAVAAALRG
ncbi:MAG: response regulator [Deltaproteobacteria bacterium]|nr:response regulator [Deltaproteobacteria bacterium]